MGIDVFQIPGKTWWVRYSEEHGWGCTTGDGPLWFKEPGNLMPLLPLLELESNVVHELVSSGARNAGLPPAAEEDFPYSELIIYALNWETDYWPGEAIKWLEGGFSLNRDIAKVLVGLSHDQLKEQRLRHRARALSKH